jgi:hypothetical protein
MSDHFDPAEDDIQCPGWDAIDSSTAAIYGDQEPLHFGTLVKFALGGPDPLDGFSVFRSEKDRPHWHYVTYGFSELYEKESEELAYSGYGFELTMRIPIEGDEPPMWVMNFFQNIARYVFSSGNTFEPGHYMDANGPLCLETDTEITAMVFAEDPEMPGKDTPNGRVNFLQVVGITKDELKAIKQWHSMPVVKLLSRDNPFLLTDLKRPSIMKQPDVVAAVEEGINRDGSSTGMLFVDALNWKIAGTPRKNCTISVGSLIVPELKAIVPARLGHDKPLMLFGNDAKISLVPAAATKFEPDDAGLRLELTKDDMKTFMSKMQESAGVYDVLPDLKVEVIKQVIKDADAR